MAYCFNLSSILNHKGKEDVIILLPMTTEGKLVIFLFILKYYKGVFEKDPHFSRKRGNFICKYMIGF